MGRIGRIGQYLACLRGGRVDWLEFFTGTALAAQIRRIR